MDSRMDIVVGAIPKAQIAGRDSAQGPGGAVEGQVLAVRLPRGTRSAVEGARSQPDERRRRRGVRDVDPPGSKVLTLLIPDPTGIPADVGTARYRVIVRFVRAV